jgi:ABC-2 type transport system permease protein
MRQLMAVLRHECRLLRTDGAVILAALLLGLAVVYGVWNGARWVASARQTLQLARATEAETIARQREEADAIVAGRLPGGSFSDPSVPGVVGGTFGGGRFALLPPEPLAVLSIGQSDLRPSYVQVSLQPIQTVLSRDEIENPQTLLVGRFDFAFVLVYLFPLVIIALSYQLLSAERENGTLSLLLSQPIALGTLLTGKVLARLLLLLSVVGGMVAIASLVGGIDLAGAETSARLLLAGVVIIAYGLFWFALAVVINLLRSGSAANALALLAAWLALVIVVPATVNVVAARLYPAPSRMELVQAIRRGSDAAEAKAAQLLAEYFRDHPDMVPGGANPNMSEFYSRTIAVQTEAEASAAPIIERFATQMAAQRRLVDRFQYLSPAVLTRTALNDLAGSGDARYQDFVRQIEAYHARWRDFFVARIMRQSKMGSADHDRIPLFQYVAESEASVRARVVRSLGGLFVPVGVLVAVASALARRHRLST